MEDEDDDDSSAARTTTLSPGSCFGVLAAINEMQPTRTETVRVPEESPKLCILKPECIMVSVESYRKEIEGEVDTSKALTVSQVYDVLQNTPPFSTVYDWFTAYKASVFFRSKIFPKDCVLFHQGVASELFYIIVYGTVSIMHNPCSKRASGESDNPLVTRNILKHAVCLSKVGANECLGQSAIFSHCNPWQKVVTEDDYIEKCMGVCSTEVMCLVLKKACIRKLGTACMSEIRKIHRSRLLFHEERLKDLKDNDAIRRIVCTKRDSVSDIFVESEKSPGLLHAMSKDRSEKTREPFATPSVDPTEKPIIMGKVIDEATHQLPGRNTKASWQTPFGSSSDSQRTPRKSRLIGKGKNSRYYEKKKRPKALPALARQINENDDRQPQSPESNEAQQSRIKGILSGVM